MYRPCVPHLSFSQDRTGRELELRDRARRTGQSEYADRRGQHTSRLRRVGDLKLFEPKTMCPFIAVRDREGGLAESLVWPCGPRWNASCRLQDGMCASTIAPRGGCDGTARRRRVAAVPGRGLSEPVPTAPSPGIRDRCLFQFRGNCMVSIRDADSPHRGGAPWSPRPREDGFWRGRDG